jgi:hypothetical protein
MLPIFMRMQIKEKDKRGFRLFFPVILIWIILFAVMLLFAPLVLLIAIMTWRSGHGKRLLLAYPMLFFTLWALSGLGIHIENKDKKIVLLFK